MKRAQRFLLAFTLLAVGVTFVLHRTAARGEDVEIIVNKTNPIGALSFADAKKAFLGDKTTWPDGKRITVLMLAQGLPERTVVLREIYKMPEDQIGQYFVAAAFAGKVTAPPREMATAAQMKQAVADNLGAIGYVRKEDVDGTVKAVLELQ